VIERLTGFLVPVGMAGAAALTGAALGGFEFLVGAAVLVALNAKSIVSPSSYLRRSS
jgi:hypothetical protein